MLHKNLFYFDIETVGKYKDLETLKSNDERGYKLFLKKYNTNSWLQEKGTIEESYLQSSSILSAFGKIVCISFGYYTNKNEIGYTINSLYGNEEKIIVKEFNNLLKKVGQKHMLLSGWRILSFDIPWIVHKLNKYEIVPSNLLDIYGVKPWEIKAFDLADEWKQKFGHYTSFDETTYELGIDSSKDDIDGSKVHQTYWNDQDINRIKVYCEKDVLKSMQVSEKMIGHR